MSGVVSPSKAPHCNRRWVRCMPWLVALVVVLLCALPIGLRLGAEYWLNEQPDMSAQLGDVDLNLFSGTLQLENLELYHFQQPVFSAQKMMVKINWWPLLRRRVHVEQVIVDGGVLYLTQEQDALLVIAGFSLADASPQEPAVLPDTPAAEETPAWGIYSGHVSVHNFQLRYQTPTVELDVVVNQLSVEPVVSWRSELASPMSADLVVNGSALNLEGAISPFAPDVLVDTSIGLTGFNLNTVAKTLDHSGLSEAAGAVDCALQMTVSHANDEERSLALALSGEIQATDLRAGTPQAYLYHLSSRWAGDVTVGLGAIPEVTFAGDLSLSDVDLDLLASGLKIEQPHLAWHGKGVLVGEKLTLAADLSLTESSITDLTKQRQLFALKQLELSAVSIEGLEQINIDSIVAQGVQVLQRGVEANSSHSVAIEQMSLSPVLLSGMDQLHVSALRLAGLTVGLTRTVNGALDLQEWFPPATEDDASEPLVESQVKTESTFSVRVDEIKIDQNSHVRLVDSTMNPPISVAFNDLLLQINDLDSNSPQQQSTVVLSSQLGNYSRLAVNGYVKPFMQPLDLELKGTLREFNLATISPYSEKSIGYQLQQGQMNLDFTLPIENGMMALESDINLKQLRLEALTAEDEKKASQNIGLPINLALSLLRDRSGDIDLHLPVHGNINDPSIRIGSIVRSAVIHTLHNTVMLPLAPLGIVSKAGNMLGIGNALNFERVVFETGTAVMPKVSKDYLTNIVTLLNERPQLSISACGVFTEADRQVLMLKDKDVELVGKMCSDLADQRAVMVKELLLDGGIEPARVLLCLPTTSMVTGAPGVELVLQ